MARIKLSSLFKEHFRRRANRKLRALFERRLAVFQKDPFSASLRTHNLKYNWAGHGSFSLTADTGRDDYRVVFKKTKQGVPLGRLRHA
jgi:mRNA-degrading endonuclease YafQ of YafQ-DinJ toxin-antitoxin module